MQSSLTMDVLNVMFWAVKGRTCEKAALPCSNPPSPSMKGLHSSPRRGLRKVRLSVPSAFLPRWDKQGKHERNCPLMTSFRKAVQGSIKHRRLSQACAVVHLQQRTKIKSNRRPASRTVASSLHVHCWLTSKRDFQQWMSSNMEVENVLFHRHNVQQTTIFFHLDEGCNN